MSASRTMSLTMVVLLAATVLALPACEHLDNDGPSTVGQGATFDETEWRAYWTDGDDYSYRQLDVANGFLDGGIGEFLNLNHDSTEIVGYHDSWSTSVTVYVDADSGDSAMTILNINGIQNLRPGTVVTGGNMNWDYAEPSADAVSISAIGCEGQNRIWSYDAGADEVELELTPHPFEEDVFVVDFTATFRTGSYDVACSTEDCGVAQVSDDASTTVHGSFEITLGGEVTDNAYGSYAEAPIAEDMPPSEPMVTASPDN